MAAVFDYVEGGGQEPRELVLAWNIEQYGVGAVMGRSYLGVREMRAMNIADGIYAAYNSRKNYRDKDGQSNWAEWSERYPRMSEILSRAIEAING